MVKNYIILPEEMLLEKHNGIKLLQWFFRQGATENPLYLEKYMFSRH